MLSLHDTTDGRCDGCLQKLSVHCQFNEPYGDGITCLRETVSNKYLHFVDNIYPYIMNGQYLSKGNIWQQDNKQIEMAEIVTQALREIRSG